MTSTTLEETEKTEQRELTLKERRQREKEKQRRDDDDHDGSRSSHHKHHKDRGDKHRSHKHHSKKSKSKDNEKSRDRSQEHESEGRRSRSRSRKDSKSKEKERSHRSSKDHSNSSSGSKKHTESKTETFEPYVPEPLPLEPKKEEVDVSDHEPSSTVIIKTPEIGLDESAWIEDTKAVWRGSIHMPDVARFHTALQTVSGDSHELNKELTNVIDCVGRISTQLAWDYIAKIKKTKDISVLRCLCSEENEEQKKAYMKLYSYLSNRNRLGVVQTSSTVIRDFYILPLDKDAPVPAVLTPLDCPGFNENR